MDRSFASRPLPTQTPRSQPSAAAMLATLFFREAVRALARHKLRSALTTLGICIGIAAAEGWLRGVWVGSGQLANERSIRRAVYAAPGAAGLGDAAGRRRRAESRQSSGA